MSKRIVVADDEFHITKAISMKLVRAGYDVTIVHNGAVALTAISETNPSLLITDFQMPILDGLELIRALRTQPETRTLPVILLTAKGFELNEEQLKLELGIHSVVAKPFSPRELLRLVQSIVLETTSSQSGDPTHCESASA
jgi:two-component system alkaline phosphatase synthesis response regulator PhoP